MAKKLLLTTNDGKYHNVKKGYLTIGNIYRDVKKAYVTVGGVYRPCWSLNPIESYGVTRFEQMPRCDHVAVTLNNHALFAGGYADSHVDVFDSSLTNVGVRLTIAPVRNLAATVVKTTNREFALFAGGMDASDTPTDLVYAVDTSFTVRQPGRLAAPRGWFTATTIPSADNANALAVFAGGSANSTNAGFANPADIVDVIDSSLTSGQHLLLQAPRCAHASAVVGQTALFAGGIETGFEVSYKIESLNYSGTMSIPKVQLIEPVYFNSATSNGSTAVFSCGYSNSIESTGRGTPPTVVDASLTGSVIKSAEPDRRWNVAATTLGDYAMFGGGLGINTMIYYDYNGLTATTGTPLSVPRHRAAATTLGNYALFGGGDISGDNTIPPQSIDVYKLM